MKRSLALSLDKTDLKKTLRDIAFVAAGQLVAFLPHWFETTSLDFGDYKPLIGLVITGVVMLLNRFIRDNAKVGLFVFAALLLPATADAGIFLQFGFSDGPAAQAARQRRAIAHEKAMQKSFQSHAERMAKYGQQPAAPRGYYLVPRR